MSIVVKSCEKGEIHHKRKVLCYCHGLYTSSLKARKAESFVFVCKIYFVYWYTHNIRIVTFLIYKCFFPNPIFYFYYIDVSYGLWHELEKIICAQLVLYPTFFFLYTFELCTICLMNAQLLHMYVMSSFIHQAQRNTPCTICCTCTYNASLQ